MKLDKEHYFVTQSFATHGSNETFLFC